MIQQQQERGTHTFEVRRFPVTLRQQVRLRAAEQQTTMRDMFLLCLTRVFAHVRGGGTIDEITEDMPTSLLAIRHFPDTVTRRIKAYAKSHNAYMHAVFPRLISTGLRLPGKPKHP